MNIIVENKELNFYYFIIKNYNAGMVLKGWEVRNIKNFKSIQINKSIIIIKNNELFLKNTYIKDNLNLKNNIKREIKILLKKCEILDIYTILNKNNYLIIPKNIFLKNNIIKSKISIVKKKLKKLF